MIGLTQIPTLLMGVTQTSVTSHLGPLRYPHALNRVNRHPSLMIGLSQMLTLLMGVEHRHPLLIKWALTDTYRFSKGSHRHRSLMIGLSQIPTLLMGVKHRHPLLIKWALTDTYRFSKGSQRYPSLMIGLPTLLMVVTQTSLTNQLGSQRYPYIPNGVIQTALTKDWAHTDIHTFSRGSHRRPSEMIGLTRILTLPHAVHTDTPD